MFDKATNIVTAKTENLAQLAVVSGNNSRLFFYDADFNGVDIRGQDLTKYDLGCANFEGVIASPRTRVLPRHRRKLLSAALKTIADKEVNLTVTRGMGVTTEQIDYLVLIAALGRKAEANAILKAMLSQSAELPMLSDELFLSSDLDVRLRRRAFRLWATAWSHEPRSQIVFALMAYDSVRFSDFERLASKFVDANLKSDGLSTLIRAALSLEQNDYPVLRNVSINWVERHLDTDSLDKIFRWYVESDRDDERMDKALVAWLKAHADKPDNPEFFTYALDKRLDQSLAEVALHWLNNWPDALGDESVIVSLLEGEYMMGGSLFDYLEKWVRSTVAIYSAKEISRALQQFIAKSPQVSRKEYVARAVALRGELERAAATNGKSVPHALGHNARSA